MITRSDLRNACYRAKKGVAQDKHRPLLDMIEPLLDVHQRWENFPAVWDVMVKGDEVKIITPETDYDYIHSTILEASLLDRKGISFDSFDDRQANIITIVQILMLDGIMTWENYNKDWGVKIDPELKQLQTVMYKVKPSQIQVTDEMIKASMKDADGNPLSEQQATETELEIKLMSAKQRKEFEKFLAEKQEGVA